MQGVHLHVPRPLQPHARGQVQALHRWGVRRAGEAAPRCAGQAAGARAHMERGRRPQSPHQSLARSGHPWWSATWCPERQRASVTSLPSALSGWAPALVRWRACRCAPSGCGGTSGCPTPRTSWSRAQRGRAAAGGISAAQCGAAHNDARGARRSSAALHRVDKRAKYQHLASATHPPAPLQCSPRPPPPPGEAGRRAGKSRHWSVRAQCLRGTAVRSRTASAARGALTRNR